MFSQITLSAAALLTLSALALAAPTPTDQSSTSTSTISSTTLLPLYLNGQNINTTIFSPPSAPVPSPSSATPPTPYTYIDPSTSTNITIVNQAAAVPSFTLPAQDLQLFATFALSAYTNASASHSPSDSLPNDGKLDIGAKLVNEVEDAGAHTVHVTVVRDPMTATGPFTYADGGVVVKALQKWSEAFAVGSFAGCAGVLVQSAGGNMVAQGNFCGAKA